MGWNYKYGNFENRNTGLFQANWKESFDKLDFIDAATIFFTVNIKAAAMKHIPHKPINLTLRTYLSLDEWLYQAPNKNVQLMILRSTNNPQKYWSIVKNHMTNKVKAEILTLSDGTTICSTDMKNSEQFNLYFEKQSTLENIPQHFNLLPFCH